MDMAKHVECSVSLQWIAGTQRHLCFWIIYSMKPAGQSGDHAESIGCLVDILDILYIQETYLL